MASIFNAEDFIGGGDNLDGMDGANLVDGMKAAVFSPDSFAPYILDDDIGGAENSPLKIVPDVNPGDKRWLLRAGVFAGLTSYGSVGIGMPSPSSVLHIKASVPGNVGDNQAGQFIIQNPANDVNANVVITAYKSDGSGNPDQQLWYLGSSAGANENILFLNRRNASLSLGTNNLTRMTISDSGHVTFTGNLVIGNGKTIGQTSGPLLTFNDTSNVLKITGCQVIIGATSGNGILNVTGTNAAQRIAEFLGDDASHNRIVIDGPIDADSQLSFCHGSSTCWSIGNNADNDAFMIRTGAGAFGTNDKFAILPNGNVTFVGASVTIGKASTTTGTIVLHDSNSVNTITLTVPDISAGSLSFTLPPTDGDNTNVLQTDGNGVLTWAAAGGGGTGFGRPIILTPQSNCGPAADFTTQDTIAGGSTPAEIVSVLDFDAGATEYADFKIDLPPGYAGGGLTVTVKFSMTSDHDEGTPHQVRWEGAFARIDDDGIAISGDHAYDFNGVSAIVPSVVSEVSYEDITFTDGADMDSLAAGEMAILRIRRKHDHVDDNATGDAELQLITIKET